MSVIVDRIKEREITFLFVSKVSFMLKQVKEFGRLKNERIVFVLDLYFKMIEELEEMSKNSKDLITDIEMTKILIFSLMMIINLTIGE